MRQRNRIWHQFRSLIRCVSEHHTLVAGSDRIKHLYVDPQKHADLGTAELA